MQLPVSEFTEHQELRSGEHLALVEFVSMDKHHARMTKSITVKHGVFKIDDEWLKHYAIVSIGHGVCMCNIDLTPKWRRRSVQHA